MTDQELERRLRDWYRSEIPADEAAPAALRSSLTAIPKASPALSRKFGSRRGFTLLAAAALLTTSIVGGALIAGSHRNDSPSIVLTPDATSTSTQPSSELPGPLLWTPASLKEDWPGPVRPEPAGGAIVVPLQENADEVIPDPLGDTGSAAHPWVDIRELQGGGGRIIIELGALTPHVPPSEQWIAYGVVVDDDRDGIPDRRFGIDNIPGTAPGSGEHRAWMTDLHTGRTVVGVAAILGGVGETYFDTFFPSSVPGRTGAWLQFGGQSPGGGSRPGLVDPFYAWASVIVDGRVVATDYAPDVGWLLEAKP